ncbi:MAG: hypothetical protein AW07_00365 [Candidatus Accumulibacter sp. SK-11]|nr:MAG: hypothetical protein AW07_00365 [Candidatus Accumulibacter sp. SK-11]
MQSAQPLQRLLSITGRARRMVLCRVRSAACSLVSGGSTLSGGGATSNTGSSFHCRPRSVIRCRCQCPTPSRSPQVRLGTVAGSQPSAWTQALSRATGSVEAPIRPIGHRSC